MACVFAQRPVRSILWALVFLNAVLLSLPRATLAENEIGRLVHVQGIVRVASGSEGDWVLARAGQRLGREDVVETGAESRAAMLLWDESQLHLHSNTRVALHSVAPSRSRPISASVAAPLRAAASRYRLWFGKIWMRANREVRWEVSNALVGVRGTEFGIHLDASQESRVWVLAGEVTVQHPLGTLVLGEMEWAEMGPSRAPRKDALLLRPTETVQWILRYPVWVSPRDVPLAPHLEGHEGILEIARLRDRGRNQEARERLTALPPGPLRALLMGWLALDQGGFGEAERWFRDAPPNHPLTWAGRCLALFGEGRWEEGERVAARGMEVSGDSPVLVVLKGVGRLGRGDPEGALPLLEAAASVKGEPLAWVQRAVVALAWHQRPEAREGVVRARLAWPSSPTAAFVSALLLRGKGDLEGALAEVRSALAQDPRHLPALIQAAELCMGMERESEAREYLTLALRADPRSGHAHTLEGFLHLAGGREEEAGARFGEALALDESSSEAYLGKGILHMRRNEPDRALEMFLTASLLDPYASLPLSYLAKVLHETGRREEALRTLSRAAFLDPQDPTPHLYRGLILRDLHRPAEAVDALEESLVRNRGRCVYRSRFLLDQDRAVRNVNLAEAYREMGLLGWARHRALLSVREDPTNSSAHLFFSTPLREEGRVRAGLRELFRAQMLAPVNANTYNSFHDYTMLFESPRLQGELEGGAGEHGLGAGSLFIQGSRGAVAGDLVLFGSESRGFHGENHGERDLFGRTDWKLRVHPDHEFLLRWETLHWVQGDHGGDLDAEHRQDPHLHQNGAMQTATLGHRWRRGPREEVLLYGIWSGMAIDLRDRVQVGLGNGFRLDAAMDWEMREEHVQAGVIHLGRSGEHRWEWGVHGVRGRDSLLPRDRFRILYGGVPLLNLWDREIRRVRPGSADAHVGDVWEAAPGLFLEVSLHLQWAHMGSSPPVLTNRAETHVHWGPRAGAIWSVTPRDTVRLGVAQYLEPPFSVLEGLQPVEVAGFPLGEDAAPGSWNREVRAAWDRSWGRAWFTHVSAGARIHRVWEERTGGTGFQARDLREWGWDGEINAILHPRISVAGRYRFRHRRWLEVGEPAGVWPEESWAEHRTEVELRWIHPAGWRVLLRENGVLQRGELGAFGHRQEAFWTDLEVEKFLGGRRWSIRAAAENLFDQPFRLRTWELQEVKGRPARQISVFVRYQF